MPVLPNHLIRHAISYGIDAVTLRATLRGMNDDLVADGPGATLGVHGLGVFYVERLTERFIATGSAVYRVPERDVVRLRPSKNGNVETLDESEMVEIQFDLAGPAYTTWRFESASRADRFTQTLPAPWNGESYDLVRVTVAGKRKYCLVWDGFSGDLAAGEDIQATFSPDRYYLFRWPVDLNSNIGGGFALSAISANQTFRAALAGTSSPLYPHDDPTYGREAKAWLAQRAIALSER